MLACYERDMLACVVGEARAMLGAACVLEARHCEHAAYWREVNRRSGDRDSAVRIGVVSL